MKSHMVGSKGFLPLFALFSVAALLIILFVPMMSQGAGTGVGVFNSPPTFVDLSVIDHVDRVGIYASVSDYNGWDDIASVNLKITDNKNRLICNITYYQYNADGVRTDSFVDNFGSCLISPDPDHPTTTSYVQRFHGVGWFEDNTTQKVVFMIQPLNGAFVNVTAYDKDGAFCTFEGPFSAKYSEPPVITNITITIGISLIAATGAAAYAVYGRKESNKMAKRIESILSQVYEE